MEIGSEISMYLMIEFRSLSEMRKLIQPSEAVSTLEKRLIIVKTVDYQAVTQELSQIGKSI